ncbi:MAG: hypothetical protein RL563_1882 [Pseudomonadota bacterium]|jgi:VWFA-related protein
MMKVFIFMVCYLGLQLPLQANESGELRLIQVQTALPRIELWLELPVTSSPKPEHFNVTLGPRALDVVAVDSFNQTGEGVAYIFLVDVSKSLSQQQFLQIQSALWHWLSGMGPKDRAAIISFGSEVKQRLAFTADKNQFSRTIDGLLPSDKDTQLYMGLLAAIEMGRLQNPELPARRAIVVFSDGIDDAFNGVTLDEVQKQIMQYRVPIYSIGFAKPPLDDQKREGLKVLGLLARQSGGRFVQSEVGQLEQAYAQQHQHISQAYRMSLLCQDCVADGQLQHLNVNWNQGDHSISEGLDLRLLPAFSPDVEMGKWITNTVLGYSMAGLSILIFIGWLYRQRQVTQFADEKAFEVIEVIPQLVQLESSNIKRKGISMRLAVMSGNQKGQVFQLEVIESLLLGRAPNCDLSIEGDDEISNQHALVKSHDGQIWVRDLKSTNGTWVNGVPIHNEYPLRADDLLLLGRTELRVVGLG